MLTAFQFHMFQMTVLYCTVLMCCCACMPVSATKNSLLCVFFFFRFWPHLWRACPNPSPARSEFFHQSVSNSCSTHLPRWWYKVFIANVIICGLCLSAGRHSEAGEEDRTDRSVCHCCSWQVRRSLHLLACAFILNQSFCLVDFFEPAVMSGTSKYCPRILLKGTLVLHCTVHAM